jgi:dipeptidyl-peptidase-3
MEAFGDAQKAWVRNKAPVVESIMGFVEPHRDPHGVRGECEGFVGISDPVESLKMRQFVDRSTTFIRLLPWADAGVNDGKGPFEKDVFVAPDYTSSYCMQLLHTPSAIDTKTITQLWLSARATLSEATNVPNVRVISNN